MLLASYVLDVGEEKGRANCQLCAALASDKNHVHAWTYAYICGCLSLIIECNSQLFLIIALYLETNSK